jgi:outer membrane protein OmpA-like peptidoglycan-associated protein
MRMARLTVVLVPLLLVASMSMAQFDPPRIAMNVRPANTGNVAEAELKDRLYLINKGVEANINAGEVLNVYRERTLYTGMPPLRLFIGTMEITTAQRGHSLGRFTPNAMAMLQPSIKYKIPVKNDIVVPRLILDSGVLFDPGSDDLKPKVEEEFAKIANFVQNFSPSKLIIEGHTDADGPEDLNMKLSELRAENVRLYLINAYDFITPAMVESKGYGESLPFVNNDTPENKSLNRRIEIVVWE